MNTTTRFETTQTNENTSPRWIQVGFWGSFVIAIAVVLRRLVALVLPARSSPSQMLSLDAAFASHKILTLAHILPAVAFVLLTPFVLSGKTKRPKLARLHFLL